LTNSALEYEPKCGERGGIAGSQPMSTVVHRSTNKLWRSNSYGDESLKCMDKTAGTAGFIFQMPQFQKEKNTFFIVPIYCKEFYFLI
jgi:hypothetical protein